MPAGRPPIPAERRKISASGDGMLPGGHRPGKEIEIRGSDYSRVPDVPDGLGDRGTTEWNRIWIAGKVWLHPAEDYHWIEMISRAYDDIAQFRTEIEKTGLIVKGYAGQLTANPLLREIREAESVIRKCLSQIGFSPTDRARLGLAEIKRQTGMAGLQAKINEKRGGKAA
jgi:P27 family predicted phage terminase small subunit